MNIELRRKPRYDGASDEWCVWDLIVNTVVLGTYYGGKEKKYLNPEKWAEEQLKKRLPVIERNINRLQDELNLLLKERDLLTNKKK